MTRRRLVVLVATALTSAGLMGIAVLPGRADERTINTVPAALDEAAAGTNAAPTTTTTSTTTPLPALPAGGLSSGSRGRAVLALEERLVAYHYDPGEVDEKFDGATAYAVMAFEKVAGLPPTGRVDALLWQSLDQPPEPPPMLPEGGLRRVEVDKVRQLLFLYEEGLLTLISHVSTGSERAYCANGECGAAVTPAGSHRFLWRVSGWRQSRLGRLYNPVYFTSRGIAIHGFPSVPTHPASHGCVRIPMHTASWFPSRVKRGDPVYVFDGVKDVVPLGAPTKADRGEAPTDNRAPLPSASREAWLDGQPPATTPTTEPERVPELA